jgi:hypothetical protein
MPPPVPVVSPNELEMKREMAAQLMKSSQQPVTDVFGGVANIADALVGGLTARKAGEKETAALEGEKAAQTASRSRFGQALAAQLGVTDPNMIATLGDPNVDPGALVALLKGEKPEPYTLGPGQTRFAGDKPVASVPATPDKPTPYSDLAKIQSDLDAGLIDDAQAEQAFNQLSAAGGIDFNDQGGLRKEIQALPSYKKLAESLPIYKSMIKSAQNNTRAADLDLVYGMAKILDPIGAVRGEDSVMVGNTASIPDWFQGQLNRLNGGQGLLPETRNAILQQAGIRVGEMKAAWDQDLPLYEQIVGSNPSLKRDQIIPDLGELPSFTPLPTGGGPLAAPPSPAPTSEPAGAAADELKRRGYTFTDGKWVKGG